MRAFNAKALLFALPLLLLMATVNYTGDAANIFSNWYEKKISTEILAGHHVTNISNYNERLLQKELIMNGKPCPDILVIGSSRVMQINSSYVADSSFFNAGLSGASIEDLYAIMELFEGKNCRPGKVIIGLDPWTLNDNNEQNRWKYLSKEYQSMYEKIFRKPVMNTQNQNESLRLMIYAQLFSPSYFQKSIETILYKNKQPYWTDQKVNDMFTKLSDGSVTYGIEYRTVSKDIIAQRNNDYLTGSIPNIENFKLLSPVKKNMLEQLVKYLLSKNITIVFFLSPYHPAIFNKINNTPKYKPVIESENYFIELAMKYKIELLGSFNPEKLKLDGNYFYDGLHCTEVGVEKIYRHNY